MRSNAAWRALGLLGVVVAVLASTGCSASRVREPHSVRGTYGRAAGRAAADWRTWAPLVAAVAFKATGWDERVSDHVAGSETGTGPIHGRDTAATLSDITAGLGVASGLLAPLMQRGCVDPDGCGGVASRGRRLAVSSGALLTTVGTTEGLKALTGRVRPNGEDDASFPSGHTALTACGAAFARNEIRRMRGMRPRTRALLDATYTLLPVVTGALRVRAKKHYPSDVLAGWGLGNFLGSFAYEGFVLPRGYQPRIAVHTRKGDTTLELGLSRDL